MQNKLPYSNPWGFAWTWMIVTFVALSAIVYLFHGKLVFPGKMSVPLEFVAFTIAILALLLAKLWAIHHNHVADHSAQIPQAILDRLTALEAHAKHPAVTAVPTNLEQRLAILEKASHAHQSTPPASGQKV